ncbi:glycyl-tRNA synthetase beta chain [Gracilibacillus ureilyticus]|uniref:Glycine--tRNA ligase beta subunit n=1 Tax=Gracilibacillus ureilyticus TaxID=531814 RepID=A0A1H9M1X0_9BACI|nr:glycine--tRNA ligase subunit beta [Gracilibacillus ureilyticus]SER17668.1 glycyl-tRNA synthetase beta chain [Gracilibacillus ureilyticus]
MTTTNVLFEVGLEEMPARFMNDTEAQLKEKTEAWLNDLRLNYDSITTYITPRRFAVVIKQLQSKQDDQEEEVKGPAEKIAKDENGDWSKAAVGFSKGQGKNVEDIYIKDIDGTNYIFVKKFIEGKSVDELLPAFKDIILDLHFPKNMRWADQNLRFIRPIKWLVALNNENVIPFDITGVKTGQVTYGHRFLGGKTVLSDPLQYEQLLEQEYVIADAAKREQLIVNGIKQLEKDKGWTIPIDYELLNEVKHLVEYPTVFSGTYHESFLEIPKEVLITSMKEHQRYFPVTNNNGDLLPFFVAVRNGTDEHIETVSRGNEKVLRARLQDAQFFYEEDQKLSIDRNIEQLSRMVFQEKLGTIADKVSRVTEIAAMISSKLGLDDQELRKVKRAAEICKFDLVTNMVTEFTELQGVMGRKYAEIFGEDKDVAQAIEEHYMPKNANAKLPESVTGAVVSIADKLDTIVGCFTVGLIPSGSQDPYALRRQALGVVQIVSDRKWKLNISDILEQIQVLFESHVKEEAEKKQVHHQLETFFKQRTAYIMKEEKIESDIIDAVLATELKGVSFLFAKASLLSAKRNDTAFKDKQEAFVRVLNLAKKAEPHYLVNQELFVNEEEHNLYKAYNQMKEDYAATLQSQAAEEALEVLGRLVNPIHQFFDNTMVMDENLQIRENRLALLLAIAQEIIKFADLAEINWKQSQA